MLWEYVKYTKVDPRRGYDYNIGEEPPKESVIKSQSLANWLEKEKERKLYEGYI